MKYSVSETSFLTVASNREHYLINELFRNAAVSGILERTQTYTYKDLCIYGGILLNTVAFGIFPLTVHVLIETSESLSILTVYVLIETSENLPIV